ncbi:hypothetical protein NPIL_702431 [Nephila pilipes]|uniref:Uncharacterized protein n=1 Tax=Nephila pilipes TaxID=299642 RepID=A0A8X6UQ77_NEPPI|nr:hypothetical protein NPIL_702431 [Nephila pilipes]
MQAIGQKFASTEVADLGNSRSQPRAKRNKIVQNSPSNNSKQQPLTSRTMVSPMSDGSKELKTIQVFSVFKRSLPLAQDC